MLDNFYFLTLVVVVLAYGFKLFVKLYMYILDIGNISQ